jgi:ABC-2 type transport system permease protein
VQRGPPVVRLLAGQLRYANRSFWRDPVAAFFTIVLPLMLLLLVGLAAGNELIDGRIRVAQFYTPALLASGVAMATFKFPAISLGLAREQGVLKRLRGTALPAWAYLAGRMGSTVVVGAVSTGLLVAVAVVVLDVQIVVAAVPAALATLLIGAVTFGALAFAVVAVVDRSTTVQAVTTGSVIVLGFVSDIFIVTDAMPRWLAAIGDLFPLKHFVGAMAQAFDPYLAGSAWAWGHLAVMGAWAVAAATVAVWRFSWQPRTAVSVPGQAALASRAAGTAAVAAGLPEVQVRPPGALALLAGQVRYANRALWRDYGSAFFAVAFPVLLVLLLPAVFGTGELPFGDGLRFPQWYAPAMAVYGIAVHSFVNVPEQVARARDSGILKRLRGTPLPAWLYLAGRLVSILLVGALITTATLAVGAALYGVDVPAARLPAAVLTFLMGTASLAALGLVVAALVPSARSVPAVALVFLLPLSFVSDIFMLGDLPRVMAGIGWAFPLKHFVHAMVASLNVAAPAAGFAWSHLGVLGGWGLAGAAVAAVRFRWEPRQPRTRP